MAPTKRSRTDQSPLLEWARSNGIELSGVALRNPASSTSESGNEGLGLYASESLSAGRQVLFVPYDAILSAELAASSLIGKEIGSAGFTIIHDLRDAREKWIRGLSSGASKGTAVSNGGKEDTSVTSRSVLYVLLIYLRHVHQNGADKICDKFAPFAHGLPENIPSVLRWSESDKKMQTAELQAEIDEMRPHLEQQFQVLFPALSSAKPDLFPPSIFTIDKWLWADSVFASRSFPPSLMPKDSDANVVGQRDSAGSKSMRTSEACGRTSAENIDDDDGVLVPIMDFFNHDHLSCHVDIVQKFGKDGSRSGVAAIIRAGTTVVCLIFGAAQVAIVEQLCACIMTCV